MMGTKTIVNTEQLFNYGKYLIDADTELNGLLSKLNGAFSGIGDAWADANGKKLIEGFSSFIADAQTISGDVSTLGEYAKTMAGNYNDLLKSCIGRMQ